jgi:hypothetical protein
MADRPEVFISYSHKDAAESASRVRADLEDTAARAWDP